MMIGAIVNIRTHTHRDGDGDRVSLSTTLLTDPSPRRRGARAHTTHQHAARRSRCSTSRITSRAWATSRSLRGRAAARASPAAWRAVRRASTGRSPGCARRARGECSCSRRAARSRRCSRCGCCSTRVVAPSALRSGRRRAAMSVLLLAGAIRTNGLSEDLVVTAVALRTVAAALMVMASHLRPYPHPRAPPRPDPSPRDSSHSPLCPLPRSRAAPPPP